MCVPALLLICTPVRLRATSCDCTAPSFSLLYNDCKPSEECGLMHALGPLQPACHQDQAKACAAVGPAGCKLLLGLDPLQTSQVLKSRLLLMCLRMIACRRQPAERLCYRPGRQGAPCLWHSPGRRP